MSLYHAVALIRHHLTSVSSNSFNSQNHVLNSFFASARRGNARDGLLKPSDSLRAEMLADKRLISVTDLGTGGWGDRKRRVCDIARRAAVPPEQEALLSRLTVLSCSEAADDEAVVELGTSLGISTLCLAAAAPYKKMITIEGCPELSALAKENFSRYGYGNIRVINAGFSDALNILREEGTRVRFAFIDGNHCGEALIEYFNMLMEMSGDEMTVVADDIHLSRSMFRGWQSIKNDNRIEAAVEMSHFGVLFKSRHFLQDASISGVNKNYYRIKG